MEKSPFETLKITYDDHDIVQVEINRPQVLNALNMQVLKELKQLFTQVLPQRNVRALVLSGAGDKAFVAGADIAEMRQMNAEQAFDFARLGQSVTRLFETANFITIAKVHGYALGGGCELAMACDIVVATQKSKFGQPEVSLGLIPGFGGTQRLIERVGLALALDILCANKHLNGEQALQAGLVSRVVEAEELESEVKKVIKGLLRGAPAALARTKMLTRDAVYRSLDTGLHSEALGFASCFAADEAKEGMLAFLEKRSASFSR